MDGAPRPASPCRALLIRDATAADHAGLRALYRAAWPATYMATLGAAAVKAMLDDVDTSQLRCMLPGQDERAAVAIAGGHLVGSAVVAERKGVGYLWGMYIHPLHQRRGIGTALLHRAASWLSETATVEARVLPSSPWAIAFYRRHGFSQTGREPLEFAPEKTVEALLFTTKARMLRGGDGGAPTARSSRPPPGNRLKVIARPE